MALKNRGVRSSNDYVDHSQLSSDGSVTRIDDTEKVELVDENIGLKFCRVLGRFSSDCCCLEPIDSFLE